MFLFIHKAWKLLCFILISAGLCSCSDGSNVSLFPINSSCDLPLDPKWQTVSPLCGQQDQHAAVWLADDTPIIVGTGGLVLTYTDNLWQKAFLSGQPTMNSITESEHGEAIAVGAHGTIFSRSAAGTWTKQNSGVAADLTSVKTYDNRIWAIGYAGTILQQVENVWTKIDYPTPEILEHFCCVQDTVFVIDNTRDIRIYDGLSWDNDLTGPWNYRNVYDIESTPDGRLFVLSDSLYCRDESGWSTRIGYCSDGISTNKRHFAWENDLLRIGESTTLYDTSTPDWELVPISEKVRGDFVASRDSQRWLTASKNGAITWFTRQEFEVDVSGALPNLRLPDFNDGKPVVFSNVGLYNVGAEGLIEIPGVSSQTISEISKASLLSGNSVENFYTIDNDSLFHFRNLQVEFVAAFCAPEEVATLTVDNLGRAYISEGHSLFRWDGSELSVVLESPPTADTNIWLDSTCRGQVFAWYYVWPIHLPYHLIGDEFVHVNIAAWSNCIYETPSGCLVFMQANRGWYGDGYSAHREYLRPSTGSAQLFPLDLVPGCDQLEIHGGVDHASGLYFFTGNASMVFRMNGEPWENTWDQVAGPHESELLRLTIEEDGTLVAIDSNHRLLRYVP